MSTTQRLTSAFATLALVLTFAPIGHTGQSTVPTVTRMSSSGSAVIGLSDKRVRVPLESAPTTAEGRAPTTRLSVPASPHRLYLVVRDLQAVSQPGTLFHIYLDLPDGVAPKPDDPRHIGPVNFYNAVREARGPGATGAGSRGIDVSYDITDVVKRLTAKRMLTDRPSVTIIATNLPETASVPTIGRIEVVEQ